jgi:hypothetical protein
MNTTHSLDTNRQSKTLTHAAMLAVVRDEFQRELQCDNDRRPAIAAQPTRASHR